MKKALLIVLFVVGIVLAMKNFASEPSGLRPREEQSLILGFCPTMEPYAQEISAQNERVSLHVFPNSSFALAFLREGKIDGALIGRKARAQEISSGIKERRIANGWTLLAPATRDIAYQDLKKEVVHTYLDEREVQGFLPPETHIIFYEIKEMVFGLDDQQIILADWQDVGSEYGLLIPTENGRKVPRFRAPVLYAQDPFIF